MNSDLWKELYPALKEEELQCARENLDAYLELAWEILEDARDREHAELTRAVPSSSIEVKVDSSKN